jgi:hypothetical protein
MKSKLIIATSILSGWFFLYAFVSGNLLWFVGEHGIARFFYLFFSVITMAGVFGWERLKYRFKL